MSATIEFEDGLLYVTCSGSDFSDQVDSCKYLGMKYEPAKKKWSTSPGKYKEVLYEFEGATFSEYDRMMVNNYLNSLSTFKKIIKRSERRKLDTSLLNFEPIFNESRLDAEKAINQSSLLFKYDTGVGKSFSLALVLANLRSIGECHKCIILTSSIGTMNLGNELKKFMKDYDSSKTLTINSITELKDRAIFEKDYDIIICGYDTFRSINDYYDKIVNNRTKKSEYRKSALPLTKWFGGKKGLLFLDECHLVTGQSRRTEVLLMNLPFFEYRYLFSATPTDKSEKFYPLLKIMDNALVKGMTYLDWCSQFCEIGTRFSRYAPNTATWNMGKWKLLQDELADSYMVVRDKSLLNLPPAYYIPPILIDMSPEQRAVYESFSYINMEMVKRRASENNSSLVKEMVNSFQVLQMAIDNPEIIRHSKVMTTIKEMDIPQNMIDRFTDAVDKFCYSKHFNKLSALDKTIEYECNELGNKVIVFYYHPSTLAELHKIYPKAFVMSSDIDKNERFQVIEDFKKSKEKILLCSILIGNTSFTLNECKAAIYYERDWSAIVYEQSAGRIYRVGQTEEVRFYNFLYNNCIDNLQLEALSNKKNVLDSLGRKANLNSDEWRLILGGNVEDQNLFLSKLD